jgi:threonine dehydrogenase-like Zn-dependent dehydrogenase
VVVFGQGVPGLIATRLAVLSGATVIAVDTRPERLAAAQELGAENTLRPGEDDVAEAVHEITGGTGADCAIEFSGTYEALHEAVRCVRYNGHVVASGFYQGGGTSLRLGEEFHHNRVRLVCSQIFDVHPSLSHRWDRLRLDHAIMDLQADGRLRLPELITHRFPVQEAPEAFRLLDAGNGAVLQVVLDF